jgi:integrase
MVFLGINAALGNSDIGSLPLQALDLESGWVTFPRPKTGAARRSKLWPETVAALRESIAARPKPKDKAHADLVFITKYGQPVAKENGDNAISSEFKKLLTDLGISRDGVNFYSLRHSFRTVAGETLDERACDYVMGHLRTDMGTNYTHNISDDRLQAVSQHVHDWLFGTPTACKPPADSLPAEPAEGEQAEGEGDEPRHILKLRLA